MNLAKLSTHDEVEYIKLPSQFNKKCYCGASYNHEEETKL
jgi:hypothetical protein